MNYKEIDGKIYVKKDFSWYAVDYLLDCMKLLGNVLSDEKFRESYEKMRKVIDDKMTLPTNNYIDDCYVVVEQIKNKY